MLLGWHGVHLLVWFVSEVPGLWSQFKTHDSLGPFPFPFHLSHHPQPTCTQDSHLTLEVAAGQQQLEPTWLGSQCLGNVRVDHNGCSRSTEKRNTEKLLSSSFILEGRILTIDFSPWLGWQTVGYIHLFSFTEAGFFFLFFWIYFVIQAHQWLKLFVVRVSLWDYSKNPKCWSDCWSLPSNLCNHAIFWAAFLKLFEGNGWVHLQVNPNKENERWP